MFGYIKPRVGELKVKEYELYKAIYCGLCVSMGHVSGQLSRLTLNYDYVFLSAFRMVLMGIIPETEKCTCIAHPVKKRPIAKDNIAFDYTSASASALLCEKLLDDRNDEKGMKKLASTIFYPSSLVMEKKAEKKIEDFLNHTKISDLTSPLYEYEKQKCTSADMTAEVFGNVLGEVFASGLDEKKRGIAYEAGRATGRFIYICDALDDMISDSEKGRYNPLLESWGDMALCEVEGRKYITDIVEQNTKTACRIDLERLGIAVELLDEKNPLTPVLKNIVYLGMPDVMNEIIVKHTYHKEEKITNSKEK